MYLGSKFHIHLPQAIKQTHEHVARRFTGTLDHKNAKDKTELTNQNKGRTWHVIYESCLIKCNLPTMKKLIYNYKHTII